MANKEMSYTITCGDISVVVTPKKIKRLHLRVKAPDGRVEMSVPYHTPRTRVEEMIQDHLAWIYRAKSRIKAKPENKQSSCTDGETILLFGEPVSLRFVEGTRGGRLVDGSLIIGVARGAAGEARAQRLETYLKERLASYVAEHLPLWAGRIGVSPTSWYLRKMKTRWGTCNTRTARICFNSNLIHYPTACITYVIIHELCHLRIKGHDRSFWNLVGTHCPYYKEASRVLKGR